jgi:4-diphosphocytidyl-2-C-methyl-D-erythritol kinase
MPTTARAYGKINIGLLIGAARDDGFHELRTIYQTIALHDMVRVEAKSGSGAAGIEIRSKDPRVPGDETNTCYRVAERILRLLKKRAKVAITIEKKLPVQGGLGAASSNGVATMLALERELRERIPPEEKLRIAAEVGSDLPLFALGGAVLGIGRGEQVFPLPDLPELHCVVALPQIAVSTPQAFERWDELRGDEQIGNGQSNRFAAGAARRLGYASADPFSGPGKLTEAADSDRINLFSRSLHEWLGGYLCQSGDGAGPATGVPRGRKQKDRGDRAEALLLDLVRAGIENDFERVVFPEYPELREVKRALERNGARYSSLSGSGSALYGLFASADAAEKCCAALVAAGTRARVTRTLGRSEYWKTVLS